MGARTAKEAELQAKEKPESDGIIEEHVRSKKYSVAEYAWLAGHCLILVGGLYCIAMGLILRSRRPWNRLIYHGTFLTVCVTYSLSLLQLLDGAQPGVFALLPVNTFQWLVLAALWTVTRTHFVKLVPFVVFSFYHVFEAFTSKTSRTGKTKERVDNITGQSARQLGQIIGGGDFLLLGVLLMDCLLFRSGAVISLLFYMAFYRIRLLYSPLDGDTVVAIGSALDKQLSKPYVPANVREAWRRFKYKVEHYDSLGVGLEEQRQEEVKAINEANDELVR